MPGPCGLLFFPSRSESDVCRKRTKWERRHRFFSLPNGFPAKSGVPLTVAIATSQFDAPLRPLPLKIQFPFSSSLVRPLVLAEKLHDVRDGGAEDTAVRAAGDFVVFVRDAELLQLRDHRARFLHRNRAVAVAMDGIDRDVVLFEIREWQPPSRRTATGDWRETSPDLRILRPKKPGARAAHRSSHQVNARGVHPVVRADEFEHVEHVLLAEPGNIAWFRVAASFCEKAQFELGSMYFRGDGVPMDFVWAHVWWNIAAAAGHPEARQRLVAAEIDMTTEQRAEAMKLARDLYATLPAGGG